VIKDDKTGEVIELHCTYDPDSKGGTSPDGRKVRGTIHWVSAAHAIRAEVRLYDRLFTSPNPGGERSNADFKTYLNPQSLEILDSCYLEPSLLHARPGSHYQFERLGYFYVDHVDSSEGSPVFNRTVSLRDTWAKIEKSSL
jgi:glutaminyl-tRNA synthetase